MSHSIELLYRPVKMVALEQEHEFISSESVESIALAQVCLCKIAELLEDNISRFMPVSVVERFEIIDIHHDNHHIYRIGCSFLV